MNRKGQTGLILGIVGLIVLIGIGFLIFGNVQQTVFGVSNVEVLGEGDRVLITTSVGSGVENVVVELSQSQLNSQLQGKGWSVDRGVSIELDLIDFDKIYNLNLNENEQFRAIEWRNAGNTFLVDKDEMIEECRTDRGFPETIDATTDGILLGFRDLYCFVPVIIGVNGDFTGTSIDDYQIQVSSGSDTELLTRNNPSANLLNGDVQVSFEGSLQAPQTIQEVPFNVLWQLGEFEFLISESSSVFTSPSHPQTQMQGCSPSGVNDNLNDYIICAEKYNNDLFNILKNRNSEFAPTIVRSVEFSGTQMIVDVRENSLTSFPVVRIVVDGDFLGIDRLSGEPDIVSCVDDIDSQNGDEIVNTLSVKNIGNEEGSFEVSITCNNDKISSVSSGLISSINPDETETISIRTSGFSENPDTVESGICSIKVTDRNSGSSDSCSYNVRYEFADVICQPNTKLCGSNNDVLICSSDGTSTEVVETCDEDYICGLDGGQTTCIKGSGVLPSFPSFGGLFGDGSLFDIDLPSFDNLTSSVSGILLLVVIGIIAVAVIIIGLNILPVTRTLFRRR